MAARRRHRRDVAGASWVTANLLRLPTMLMLGVILLALAGILTLAGSREVTSSSPPNTARSSPPPTRPALTPAEERYIRELWPIHGDVERSTMRMSLGQIFYKTQDLGRAELRKRVEQALAVYRGPRPGWRAEAAAVIAARARRVRLCGASVQESAIEVLKMFEDGRDDHMLAAYPKGQAGAATKSGRSGASSGRTSFPPN